MSVINVAGVTKRFGKRTVLDNLSLEVPQGVVFALLGENGAGKSTLIKGLLGYHRFESGSASVCGLDPAKDPLRLRRTVGYVADAPGMYEWMSVAQIGWYASGFYSQGFLKRYDELTQTFELPQEQKFKHLSKGMKAKVSLALAMAFDPALLVLDEPTSGLDLLVRRSFLESMIDRAADGQTVFLSSHQIHEVERVADWIAIIDEGKLKIAAPLEELKNDVQVISFSLRDPLLALPPQLDNWRLLTRKQTGRTVECVVLGATPEEIANLSTNPNLFEVHSVRPNLEELYIAFTHSNISTENQQERSNTSESHGSGQSVA